ncbi:MAG: hypothetical protein ACRED1_03295, partial [Limisphaerales bacterium]
YSGNRSCNLQILICILFSHPGVLARFHYENKAYQVDLRTGTVLAMANEWQKESCMTRAI